MLTLYTSLFDVAYVPLLSRWSLRDESSYSIRALWKHGLVECFIAVWTCGMFHSCLPTNALPKIYSKKATHSWFWYLRTKTTVFWTQ